MKVALVQTHIFWENKQSNFENAISFIAETKRKEADIIFYRK